MSQGTLNEPIKDDFDLSIETDGYKRKIARHEAQVDLWADSNAAVLESTLSHCCRPRGQPGLRVLLFVFCTRPFRLTSQNRPRYYFLTGLAGSAYTGAARSVIAFASVGPCFQPEAVDTCLARIWTVSLNSAAALVVPDVNRTSW